MGTKSDFAEKLLHDLRLRKEKMSATHNSSPHSSQMFRGANQIKLLQNSSRRPNGVSRSFTSEESPNQIILNETDKRDLPMTISFTLHKTENPSQIASRSKTNPLVNLFNRFGRGSLHLRKMKSLSICQVPNDYASNIDITEMSENVRKLNQVLKSHPKDLNFSTNSVEFRKKLLKGAIDLEESLRMLVNLHEDSGYTNGADQKWRLRLLEEHKDDQVSSIDKLSDHRQVDIPRFSFDKRSKNSSKMVSHGKSASCIPSFDSSSQSAEEKGRISNVVAKLMGLKEMAPKEEFTCMRKDLSSDSDCKRIESNRKTEIREMKFDVRDEKRQDISYDSSKTIKSENHIKSEHRMQVLKRSKREENRVKGKKQNLVGREYKRPQVESIISSETKRNTNLQTKKKRDKSTSENEKSLKNPPRRRDVSKEDQNRNLKDENFRKKDQILNSFQAESHVGISKIRKNENPRKMEVSMTKRNRNTKQQMHRKNGEVGRVKSDELGVKIAESTKQKRAEKTKFLDNDVRDECQEQNTLDMPDLNDNCGDVSSNFEKVIENLETVEPEYASRKEQKLEIHDLSSGGGKESTIPKDLSQPQQTQFISSLSSQEQLTEPEKELKEIVIKSQLFLSTAEALFKLNIPISFFHAGDLNDEIEHNNLILDCGYEVMKRKARRYEIMLNPYMISGINFPKISSFDDLIRNLHKELEMLKFYGWTGDQEHDIADSLWQMIENDVSNKGPDVNSMWDFEWDNTMMLRFSEKEDVVREMEKHVLNVMLDEITNDLLLI